VAAFRDALALARDESDRGRAWIGIAAGLRILSRLDDAMAALDAAEQALARVDLPREAGRIHFIRGNLHFARGEPSLCLASHQRALVLARRAGDAQLEAEALGGLGDGHYASGRMRSALACFRECSDLCRERGFGRIDVSTRFMIGHCLRYENELATGLAEHEEQIAAAVRIGNRLAEMTALQSKGILQVETGRYADAIQTLDRAAALSRQLGTRRYDAIILAHRGAALIETGRRAEGQAAIDEGVAIARETGTGFVGPAVLGHRALHADDDAAARRALDEAETVLAKGCVGHNYFWFYRDAIETSLRSRRWDEALRFAQALADYTAAEPLPWSDFYISRGRALAAFGRGDRGPALRTELAALRDRAMAAQLRPAVPLLDAALAPFSAGATS
jgi:tetratricopeptide (TPR) repeat protein